MSGDVHKRRSKFTWDYTLVPRGLLTRWTEIVPETALRHWLALFDALTAEQHTYQEFPITDRRWRAWLCCRDRRHLQSTLERLQAAGLINVAGGRVVAIPVVDDVWRERAELSERKRQNRIGKSSADGGGNLAASPPILATRPRAAKSQEKQARDPTAVKRPTHYPHPHHKKPPLTPPESIDDRGARSHRANDLGIVELILTPRASSSWTAWLNALPDELSERARNSGEIRTTANWPDSPGAQLRAIDGTPCRWSPPCGDVASSSEAS